MPRRRASKSSTVVRVGLTQMACGPDVERNRARQMRLLERAARQGADIACTQELFASQYFCQTEDHGFFDLAEPIPGPTTDRLARLARRHGMVVVASLFERRAPGLYHNTAVVIDADGALLGLYRKMHIPDDPLYFEKFYFAPGDTGFRAWTTRRGRIGVLVCWDQWFPEGARLTALRGAEVLFYPTAIGWHPAEKAEHGTRQREAWELVQRSHAVANGCFVAAANRVGHERLVGTDGRPAGGDGIEFWGGSFVAAPDGRVLHRAPADREAVAVVACDLREVETARTHWPFLRDRRVDAYADLTRRFIDGG
jgi:N-carbamoylputrescine amidase